MPAAKPLELGVMNNVEFYVDISSSTLLWRIPDIRESIEAEPGMVILSADYSQIEVKLMAFLSGDKALIDAINSGKDIHAYIATEIFGKKMDFDYEIIYAAKESDRHPRHSELVTLRSRIKTVVFGVPYGAGAQRVALMTGMSEDEAQAFIDSFFERYPTLKAWLERTGQDAILFGFTASPRGRKRFYPMPAMDDPERDSILSQIRRWAGNHPIQAGNVDMLKPAMAGIYRALRARGLSYEEARILFVVHDEIVMTCKTGLVEIIKSIMQEEMEKSYQAIINGVIKNRIDVAVDSTWKKA